VKAAINKRIQAAIAGAASLTGKRFGLLVASSLVATSAIVAAAATNSSDNGPLAALLGRSLAAERTPVAVAPELAPEPVIPTSSSPEAAPSPSPAPEPLPVEAAPAPEPAPEPQPEPTPTTPTAPAPEAGQIKHVFLISLASSGYESAFGTTPQMPYLAGTLRPQGDLLTNFTLLDKASLPNSLAAVGGQAPTAATKANCPTYDECVLPAEDLTLVDQLGLAKFTWKAYMESMADPATGQPDNCVYPQPDAPPSEVLGGYSVTLNPFPYFHSLLDLGDCALNDVPFDGLEKDLKKVDSTPNYSYISPNLCNVGISGQCPAGAPDGAAAADAFLASWVPKILASPAYKKDGLLIVSFGQLNATAPVDPALPPPSDPLKVGALLVSPFVTPGATDAVAYDPYSLLRSTEDLFGLAPIGKAADTKVRSFGVTLRGGESTAGD
jgi:phosphatidylinositol-3-phosphatase